MVGEKTLLAVLAHPDDESFGVGGTLALYAARGVKVYLVCATRGEAGTVDSEHMAGFGSIAELRESELRCAARHLGLTEVFFLDYRDSGMPGSPDNLHPNAHVNRPVEEVAAPNFRIPSMKSLRSSAILLSRFRYPRLVPPSRVSL